MDALNANGIWVTCNAETNAAAITSVSDFVKAFKSVSKNLGAFDRLDAGQGENILFGYGDGKGAHFDALFADILEKLDSFYASVFEEDLQKTDAVGYTAEQKLNMYTPLYYLLRIMTEWHPLILQLHGGGQQHVKAERTGDSTANFIAWVND